MDVSSLIRNRLNKLGLEQKDLASAVQVTESYVSQLLGRKKAPPAPARTDLYDKISEFLKLPKNELSNLAELERREELKKKVVAPPRPLFKECRALVLRKCASGGRGEIAAIFEKQPFGELERLITEKLLDVAQGVAREELRSEEWLRQMAKLSHRSYAQMRVAILEFLDTDVLNLSVENCVSFLDPIIESWDIDLKTFGIEIVLNSRLAPARIKCFEFVEREPPEREAVEPGLEQFLKDAALSGDIQEEEIEFLKRLKFRGRKPSPLYYYRELQNLRDPLHFMAGPQPKQSG
ncbi:MAG TPA: helix-turn-helix transcriptional regulator [Bryobacteraceae bacterium]|nr:helix-turn-helix transcriptional regulator [Bryobacteraceae bacterium]